MTRRGACATSRPAGGTTERSAYGTLTDLAEAGYVIKQNNRRRYRYQTRTHLPLPEPSSQERTVGDVLALWPAPTRGRNGGLLGPMDDLGRFLQLRGGWPGQTT